MRDVLEVQEAVDRVEVHLARDLRVLQDRLRLRAEPEAPIAGCVEEGLLADPVAGQEQPSAAAVPDCEGEHAPQVVDAAVPELLVEVDDHLGVGSGREAMSQRLQLPAELAVVVDLAVLNHDDALVLVEDRLVAGLEVDDRQALDTEPHSVFAEGPAGVGTAVLDHLAHPLEERAVHPWLERDLSGYPTHARRTLAIKRPPSLRSLVLLPLPLRESLEGGEIRL